MAKSLGINPDPRTGGVGSGVTYVAFTGKDDAVTKNEDHAEAVSIGERRAGQFLDENWLRQRVTCGLTVRRRSEPADGSASPRTTFATYPHRSPDRRVAVQDTTHDPREIVLFVVNTALRTGVFRS